MDDYQKRHDEAHAYFKASMDRVRNTSEPPGQKFPAGSRVRIADDLGPSMTHFPKAASATVLHSYAHAYGGNNVTSYALDVDGSGYSSWYHESQLTAIPVQNETPLTAETGTLAAESAPIVDNQWRHETRNWLKPKKDQAR